MSRRSEHLDRLALDRGHPVTVWAAGWPPLTRWERFWEATEAAAYHYVRLARFVFTGKDSAK